MEREITPEPSDEERAAIEEALARLESGEDSPPAGSRWWQAGVREAVEPPADP